MTKLKKLIIAFLFPVALAGGIGGEYNLNKNIPLQDKMYSEAEYRVIRTDIADKASRDAFEEYSEVQLYTEILNIEVGKCGNKLYPFNNKQDIRDMLKKFEEEGCPK